MYRLMMRWRETGYAATGQLGSGPSWCWLTRKGMAATGLGFPADPPRPDPSGAHPRGARRPAMAGSQASLDAGAGWWHSERRLKAAQLPPGYGPREHVPDAEIHWPSLDGSPHAGQVWAIEVELTPKPLARTSRIMAELLTPPRYARVVYLTAPAAERVVTRSVATLPPDGGPGSRPRTCPGPRSPGRSGY